MNTATQFYLLARSWMQCARRERRRHGATRNVRALVAAARDAVRTGRMWQYVLSAPPHEPWPDAELEVVRRITPYRNRINFTP